jgi:hypothetical protein
MTTKRLKRPRDPIQLGKLLVEIATGQVEDRRNPKAVARGKRGGAKGGPARASSLSPERPLVSPPPRRPQ